MSESDAYIGRVAGRLVGMDPKIKQDIVMELRAHIADLVAAAGGNVAAVMMQLEPPEQVGRRYKQLYGYGTAFKALFVFLAGALAVLTLPVLQIGGEEVTLPIVLSLIFLGLLVMYLILVAVTAGKKVGLLAGAIACFVRLGVFGALALAGGSNVVVQGVGVAFFVVASIILILIGYIPGEAKARWKKPSGEL